MGSRSSLSGESFEYSETVQDHSLTKIVAARVQDFLKDERSGHDWEHIRRVLCNAKTIAACEPAADRTLVDLAALLHDVDDPKVTGKPRGASSENATVFLCDAGADENLVAKVRDVIKGIGYRSSLSGNGPQTLEQKIVSDADKLDAMGAIGIARCFVFTGKSGRPMFAPDIRPRAHLDAAAYADMCRADNTGINHFFDKLLKLKDHMATETGRRMASDRNETMIRFLKDFFEEQGENDWVTYLDPYRLNTFIKT